ncbi:MAG: hypothetical protein SGI77_01680 [Pirellulaceae bacterium]|nr:hypothetical protein [Pirellulaceae bacterium]
MNRSDRIALGEYLKRFRTIGDRFHQYLSRRIGLQSIDCLFLDFRELTGLAKAPVVEAIVPVARNLESEPAEVVHRDHFRGRFPMNFRILLSVAATFIERLKIIEALIIGSRKELIRCLC